MKKLLVVSVVVLLAATISRADVLALWENDDVIGTDTSTAVDSTHADLFASSLNQQFGSAGGWTDALTGIHNAASVNSLSAAIAAGDYFTFTITPDAGKVVSYSDLFLRYSIQANVQVATTEMTLMSSLTGFTASDGIDTSSATATVGGLISGTDTFDITGESALQSVAAGTVVEFRIYTHNTGANPMTRIGIGQGFATNGTDDLVLNGSVIPEPSSLALIGGVSIGMLWVRRRFAI